MFQVLSLAEFDQFHGPDSRPWYFTTDYINSFVKPEEVYWLCYRLEEKVQGAILICRTGDEWCSVPKAPFGGFWFWEQTNGLDPAKFSLAFGKELKSMGISQLKIKTAPAFYELNSPFLYQAERWIIESQGYSYVLPISKGIELLGDTARRKIRKMEKEGFEIRPWQPEPEELYHFIASARQREGHRLLFTEHMAQEVVSRLNQNYLIEAVWKEDQIAAIGLAVLATKGVMYHYQPADAAQFRQWSPLVLCHLGLMKRAASMNYKWLDLGSATLDGNEMPGLVRYKRSLGAQQMIQTTYVFKPA